MAGRQRTFELVPTSLARSNASRPPMTSKAAKKAYQQAQRGPRISKAEQRKRDAEEYERIRKENEKERNAAKAKAAREKKAAKALAEKEARKKLGLPEPSRFVRASQPTISRFVRADSEAKRSWKQMEGLAEDIEESDVEVEETDECRPPAKRVAAEHDSDDEFGDFPQLTQSVLEKIDSSAASAPPSLEKKQDYELEPCRRKASQELSSRVTSQGSSPLEHHHLTGAAPKRVAPEESKATSQPKELKTSNLPLQAPAIGPQKHISNELSAESVFQSPNGRNVLELKQDSESKNIATSDSKPSSSRPILQERSVNMPPPPLPFKRPSISFATPPFKPRLSSNDHKSLLSRSCPSMPPSSTQAFLENHLDDFFPSPSQQVRELLDDIDDIPSNTQVARELAPPKVFAKHSFDDLICTQDFVLTPHDLEEITTPSRAPPKTFKEPEARQPKVIPARPVSRDRPRFFQEKEEDLCQAAIHKSKNTRALRSRRQSIDAPPAAPVLQGVPTKENNLRPRRFFEEKEEDIIQAALHESKKSAPKQVRPTTKKAPLRKENPGTYYGNFDFETFFEDEEQKVLQAAIEESKKTAGLEPEKRPLKEVPEKSKRTLKRVRSTATDYGDDDFSGCSQELLALC